MQWKIPGVCIYYLLLLAHVTCEGRWCHLPLLHVSEETKVSLHLSLLCTVLSRMRAICSWLSNCCFEFPNNYMLWQEFSVGIQQCTKELERLWLASGVNLHIFFRRNVVQSLNSLPYSLRWRVLKSKRFCSLNVWVQSYRRPAISYSVARR